MESTAGPIQADGNLKPMAEIRPFRGLRFSASAGTFDRLVAPPYDVLSAVQRDEYASRSPFNIVHLTLPEEKPDDRSKYVKYARSAALLSEWRRQGVFVPDPQPSLYRYTQRFEVDGQTHVRTSIIALLKVEPFETGTVLPHEQTFPKHKEDRLRLLEATRSHLESIFGLYEDPGGELLDLVRSAPASEVAECDVDGLDQKIEVIADEATKAEIVKAFAGKRIWIADGHHRYETALGFRAALGKKDGPVPEDYMIIALASMSDPGLVLLPTHRVVPALKDVGPEKVVEPLTRLFHVESIRPQEIPSKLLEAEAAGEKRIAVALHGEQGFWLIPRDERALLDELSGPESDKLKRLDATILHRVVFEKLLELSPTAAIEYTRDAHEAILAANEGRGAAFLMTPPTIEEMKDIALAGERMPQKSTYYYPKIWGGPVAWSLNDF